MRQRLCLKICPKPFDENLHSYNTQGQALKFLTTEDMRAIVIWSLSHVWLFCNPMDCSPPGSSVHGILQASILEWVAISISRASSQPRDWTRVSHVGKQILYHQATREVSTRAWCALKIQTNRRIDKHVSITDTLLCRRNLHNIVNQLYFNKSFLITWFLKRISF